MQNNYEDIHTATISASKDSLSLFAYSCMPKYKANWHHDYICEILEKVYSGEKKKVMIFVPPQHGKSTLSSIMFPAWALGKDPSLKVAVCSYSADLAGGFNSKTQDIMMSDSYAEIFPNSKLAANAEDTRSRAKTKQTAKQFNIVGNEGYFLSVGIGGSLTGKTVDLGIIDDPFKSRVDASSPTQREKVWLWYTDVFLERLNNDSKQVLLFTRWHEDDLAGRLIEHEGDEWEIIKLPSLREDYSDPRDPREIGEALWESKHSRKTLEAKRKRNPTSFASLHQQTPTSAEGGQLKKSWFQVISYSEFLQKTNNRKLHWNVVVDGAFTKKNSSDPTAMIAFTWYKGQLFLKESYPKRIDANKLPEEVESFSKRNGVTRRGFVKIEPRASGVPVVQAMRDKASKINLNVSEYIFPKDSGLNGGSSKEEKVTSIEMFMEGMNVFLLDGLWNDQFIEECSGFPNMKHDDQLDCLCMAANWVMYGVGANNAYDYTIIN